MDELERIAEALEGILDCLDKKGVVCLMCNPKEMGRDIPFKIGAVIESEDE